MQTFGFDNIKSPTNRNRDTLFWGFGATRIQDEPRGTNIKRHWTVSSNKRSHRALKESNAQSTVNGVRLVFPFSPWKCKSDSYSNSFPRRRTRQIRMARNARGTRTTSRRIPTLNGGGEILCPTKSHTQQPSGQCGTM